MTDETEKVELPKERPKVVAMPKKKKKQTPAEAFIERMEEWKTYFEGEGKDDKYVVMFTDNMRVCLGIEDSHAMIGIYESEKISFMESLQPVEYDNVD